MERAPIDAALDAFHAAASRADVAAVLEHFTADGVFLGTDASERWQGAAWQAFLVTRFAAGRGWTMRSTRRAVVLEEGCAWFDEDLSHTRLGALRGSGVLRRGADGRWRLAQYNLALTVPNERFEAVQAAIAGPYHPSPPSP